MPATNLLALIYFCLLIEGVIGDDSTCAFSGLLNRATSKNLMTCTGKTVLADILIDERTDMNITEIDDLLIQNSGGLHGSVTIRNTNITKLEGLWIRALQNDQNGVALTVQNNTKLVSIWFEDQWKIIPNGTIVIENNPKLKFSIEQCQLVFLTFGLNRTIGGNGRDCGCELKSATTTAAVVGAMPDGCEGIAGHIRLIGDDIPPYDLLMRKFKSVTLLTGELQVDNTTLPDLAFLCNLTKIYWYYEGWGINSNLPLTNVNLTITNNREMKRLGMDKLATLIKPLVLIENNPQLCLSVQELFAVFNSSLFKNEFYVEGPICAGSPTVPKYSYIDPTKGFGGLSEDVEVILGDLNITENTDLSDYWRLANVTTVLGNLVIENSQLVTTNNLWKLGLVYPLAEPKIGLRIVNNSRLSVSLFSALYLVNSPLPLLFADNKKLNITNKTCNAMLDFAELDIRGNRGDCVNRARPLYAWEIRSFAAQLKMNYVLASVLLPLVSSFL